jgi:hypothetical protein
VLLKELNQAIQLTDMLGHNANANANANAVRWSAGTAPLADVLGRSFAWLGQ